MDWNERQGIDMPDLDYIMHNGMLAGVDFCFPHYFLLPYYSSASSYRIRPLGPEECLFELWSLTRYPPGQEPPAPPRPTPWAPTILGGPLSRPRTTRTSPPAEGPARPGLRVHAAVRLGSRA